MGVLGSPTLSQLNCLETVKLSCITKQQNSNSDDNDNNNNMKINIDKTQENSK